MLEQLVKDLLAQQALQAGIKAEKATALEPLRITVAAIEKEFSTAAVDSKIALLKAEILEKMTETTHSFQCADITKKSKRTLVITDDLALLEHLQKTAQTTAKKVKITYNFNPCKLIKAIDNKDVALPAEIAYIDADFTLAIKKN